MTDLSSDETKKSENSHNPFVHRYWCTFTDQSQKEIAQLINIIGRPEKPSEDAILLPDTDMRVYNCLHPPAGRTVQRIRLDSIEDFYRLADYFDSMQPSHLFRGQSNYEWPLKTEIERNTDEFVLSEVGLEQYEYRILCEAQRRSHNFFAQLPDENDRLSWFALLRHHGVPTRLLDVTRSLFIACYFAVRNSKPDTDAAIWVFSRNKLEWHFYDWEAGFDASHFKDPFSIATHNEPYYWPFPKNIKIDYDRPTIDSIKNKDYAGLNFISTLDAAMRGYISKPGVAIIEPFWLSRRIEFQQGAFLVPFNVRISFEENLFSFLSFTSEDSEESTLPNDIHLFMKSWFDTKVMKVRIPKLLHAQLKKKLETMNIRDLTLFPDLDGGISHLTALVPRKVT